MNALKSIVLFLPVFLMGASAIAESPTAMQQAEVCRDQKDFRKSVYLKVYYDLGFSGRSNLYFYDCTDQGSQLVCHSLVDNGPGSGAGDVEFWLGFPKDCSRINFIELIGYE